MAKLKLGVSTDTIEMNVYSANGNIEVVYIYMYI